MFLFCLQQTIKVHSYQEMQHFPLSKKILLSKHESVPDRKMGNFFFFNKVAFGEVYPHVVIQIKVFTSQANSSCMEYRGYACW